MILNRFDWFGPDLLVGCDKYSRLLKYI